MVDLNCFVGIQRTKLGRIAHTIMLYFLPTLVYVPAGLICHLYLFRDNAITFDTSTGHLVQVAIFSGVYCGAPMVYFVIAGIYYKVNSKLHPSKDMSTNSVSLSGLS